MRLANHIMKPQLPAVRPDRPGPAAPAINTSALQPGSIYSTPAIHARSEGAYQYTISIPPLLLLCASSQYLPSLTVLMSGYFRIPEQTHCAEKVVTSML